MQWPCTILRRPWERGCPWVTLQLFSDIPLKKGQVISTKWRPKSAKKRKVFFQRWITNETILFRPLCTETVILNLCFCKKEEKVSYSNLLWENYKVEGTVRNCIMASSFFNYTCSFRNKDVIMLSKMSILQASCYFWLHQLRSNDSHPFGITYLAPINPTNIIIDERKFFFFYENSLIEYFENWYS